MLTSACLFNLLSSQRRKVLCVCVQAPHEVIGVTCGWLLMAAAAVAITVVPSGNGELILAYSFNLLHTLTLSLT